MKTLKSVKFWLVVLLVVTVVATANTTLIIERMLTNRIPQDFSVLEDFRERLHLSPPQFQEVQVIMSEEREKLKRIEGKIRAEMKPHIEEVIKASYQKLESLLTPEQKEKWERLKKEDVKEMKN